MNGFEFEENKVLRNEILLVKDMFYLIAAKGSCLFAFSDIYSKGLLDTDVVFGSTLILRSHTHIKNIPEAM